MKRSRLFWLSTFALMGFFSGGIRAAGVVVHDLGKVLQIAYEITEQAKQFGKELEFFKQELEQYAKRSEQQKQDEANALSRFNLFEKIRTLKIDFLNGLKLFRRRVEKDFAWEEIMLKEMEEILNGPLFKNTGKSDPYQGIFSVGSQLQNVFSDLSARDHVTNSDLYKKNATYRQYIDELFKEEERMLQDMESRKDILVKVRGMQVESEEKLKKFQKSLQELAQAKPNATYQDGKYSNLSEQLAWNLEMNLEMARELLQQIIVKKTLAEARILRQIRKIHLDKLERIKEDEKTANANDTSVAKQLIEGTR